MGPRSIAGNRLGLIVRAALLLAGLSTYLISPDVGSLRLRVSERI